MGGSSRKERYWLCEVRKALLRRLQAKKFFRCIYILRHAHFVYLCRPDVQGFSGPDDVCVLKVSRTGCNLVGSLQSAYGLVEFDMGTSRVYSK